ncbi:DNA gyrase subunit A [Pseudomonas sp. Teo4]|nr:DNA gyrase subunit A [Pseudomonas sp. Teo4]
MRTRVGEVSSLGRNTQGVTLIKLANDETLVGLERIQEPSEEEVDELIESDEEGVEADAPDAADDDTAGAEEAPQE